MGLRGGGFIRRRLLPGGRSGRGSGDSLAQPFVEAGVLLYDHRALPLGVALQGADNGALGLRELESGEEEGEQEKETGGHVSDKMGIWMFDGQGRFIRNILWQGNGPGEVPMPGTIPFHINSEGTVSFYTDRFIQIDSTGHRIYESPLLQEELVQEPYSQVFGTDTRCWFMMNTYATCDVVSTDTEWFRTGNKPDSLFSNKTRLKTIDFNAAVPKYYCHYAWKENITNDYLFFVDCETGDWGRLYKDGRREVTKHINFGEDEDLCWVVYIRDFGDYLNLRARSVSEGFRDVLYEKATGKFTSVRSIYDDLSHSGSYNFFHTTSDGCLAIPEEFGTFLQRVENSGDSKLKDMVKDFPEDTNLVLVFFTLKNIE